MAQYTTTAKVKSYLGITASTWDTLLDSLITIASSMIDQFTGRQFYKTADTTKKYDGNNNVSLFIDDLLSSSPTVVVDDGTLGSDDFFLYPSNDTPKTEIQRAVDYSSDGYNTWPKGQQNVEITGDWGYCEDDEVPDDIDYACQELVADIFRNRRRGKTQSESVQGYNVNYGNIKKLPEVVRGILRKYEKVDVVVDDSANDTYEII